MKQVLVAVAVVIFSVSCSAGEYLINEEIAHGLRVAFSEPVAITYFGDVLTVISPEGEASEFVFSGAELPAWVGHGLAWTPTSARIVSYEWLAASELPTADRPGEWHRSPSSSGCVEGFPSAPICGVHIGGKWGTTAHWVTYLPEEYFSFLRQLGANWVGISITLTVDDSLDRTVGISDLEGNDIPTFEDTELRALVRRLREEGMHVYFTLAFENLGDGALGKCVQRWELGDPFAYESDPRLDAEFWPWDPGHPDHDEFVSQFFSTYGDWARHFASLAEEEEVELFSLGTETDCLFRTRSSGSRWPTEFLEEWTAVVSRVRAVYTGALTYDMHYGALTHDDPPGMSYPWEDLGLDVVGVSSYFPLLKTLHNGVPPTEELLKTWREIFDEYVGPIAALYPEKPVVFLEFGYVDSVGAARKPARAQFSQRFVIDDDKNGLDDGQEEQAAIYESLFLAMEENPGVLDGVFLWGHMIAPDDVWAQGFGQMREFSVRGKLAADVVAEYFDTWTPADDATDH